MNSILDIIKPITLLRGSHFNAKKTGQGCVMNVVSYLDGDDIITDRPTCADNMVTTVCVFINDFMTDSERSRLLPFIPRISGSHTNNPKIILSRVKDIGVFAGDFIGREHHKATRVAAECEIAIKTNYELLRDLYSVDSAPYWKVIHITTRVSISAIHAATPDELWFCLLKPEEYRGDREFIIARTLRLLDDMLKYTDPMPKCPLLVQRAKAYAALSADKPEKETV